MSTLGYVITPGDPVVALTTGADLAIAAYGALGATLDLRGGPLAFIATLTSPGFAAAPAAGDVLELVALYSGRADLAIGALATGDFEDYTAGLISGGGFATARSHVGEFELSANTSALVRSTRPIYLPGPGYYKFALASRQVTGAGATLPAGAVVKLTRWTEGA